LDWSGGLLQQADDAQGPYADLDAQPVSPLLLTQPARQKFFRVRLTGPPTTFDTELLQLDIAGGNLPAGMLLRESPTLPSTGATTIYPLPAGGYFISSYFDVFTELSTDNGTSWAPCTNAPPRMTFKGNSPTNTLPPLNTQYVNSNHWYAAFANGVGITNASYLGFLTSFPPPPPGGITQTHSLGATVTLVLRICSTCPFQTFQAPASMTIQTTSRP
jgi:hypothetical protein